MKNNGFHASTPGSKKVVAVSVIIALVLAAISAIAALAAPTPKSAFGSQISELNFARAWYNSARLNAANFVRTSDPAKAQQYLSQYAFALRQADALVAGRGVNTSNNNNNNGQSNNSGSSNNSNNNGSNNQSAQMSLADWLHMMRGLRDKLTALGFTANVASNGSNMAGAGVPVTGGTSSSSSSSSSNSSSATSTPTATPGTSSSSSSGSSATPTATPGTGSSSSSGSSATPTATPGTSSSSGSSSSTGVPVTGNSAANNSSALAKVWGKQFRDLEAARTWYNDFRSHPENFAHSSDPAKTQQWLSQYAFALRQADAIILGRSTTTTNNQNNANGNNSSNNNSSNGASVNRTTSAQQDLAGWLHMMRELREKLTGDASDPLGLND